MDCKGDKNINTIVKRNESNYVSSKYLTNNQS
jgi:hypothetical protein